MGEKHAVLNQGEENEMELFGYKTERWRSILCFIGYIFSLGFLRLVFYWKPELDVWCHCVPCSLAKADVVLLKSADFKQYTKKQVIVIQPTVMGEKPCHQLIQDENSHVNRSIMKPDGKVRYLEVQKIRYVWVPSINMFRKIGVLDESLSCADVHRKYGFGLKKEEQDIRRQICGFNTITVKVIPIWKLLFKEVFNPFYIFQVYSLSIWIATSYIEYSLAIFLMTFMSISATVNSLRKQSVKLHKMSASNNSIMVTVLHKNGEVEDVQSQSLVPGDVIVLSGNKLFLPCDAILLSGGCTVNEAMLTGESIPVTKTPLPNIDNLIPWMVHSGDDYKRHVLFCGTEVIQTKGNGQDLVKAVVLQTGFNTAKGDLVRFILYNKPINVKLHREALRFLSVLVFMAVCAVIYTAIVFTKNGASVHDVVLMSLLILTAAVNAALPATITLGLLYGQTRLKKLGIFCISPQRINLAGQLNLVCFDKTGTLTEDILDLYGILPCEKSRFKEVILLNSSNNLPWGLVLQAMASCHSLIKMDGKLNGDPLDLKMFEGTGWEFQDCLAKMVEAGPLITCTIAKPGSRAEKVPVEGIIILHQFPFSSSAQRMSVITQVIGESDLTVFMKGAPEMVIRYCKPDTVPDTFYKQLDLYTKQGFRVIGLAYRSLQKEGLPLTSDLNREVMETNLTFLGLLILENRLKPETSSVLEELSAANIRTVMVTGDNLQTAVTVGKNSGMIPDNSDIILLEACEPEKDLPASLTWKSMAEEKINGNPSKSKESQINIDGGWINNPTAQGNFHFVLTGSSYQVISQYFYNLLPKILLNGTIFARMMPNQKSNLIEELQKLDYFVGMCGDGANDCGALKISHAGISLSELEASVASPFTSKIPNIQCVPMLIKEGRNTLVTTFTIFKFMTLFILVGITCIGFLFWKQTLLGNYQYLLQDLAINITVALTLSLNGPAPKLAPYRPPGQLLSPPLLLSIAMHFIFTVTLQTTAFILLLQQPWYNETDVFSACQPLNHSMENVTIREHRFSENFITTTMFPITGFNLIILEFVFSKGRPFRQRLYTNYPLTCLMIVQVTVYVFVLFADIETMYTTLELVCTPYYWRVNIFIMMFVLFVMSYLGEEWFIENRKLWLWIKRIFNYKSKSQYRKLQRKLQKDSEWPPKNRTDYAIQTVPLKSNDMISSEPIYRNSSQNGKEVISEHTIVTAM
ncbi:PREDICTED: probable cation-transporting ATPase 13A4 isoform X1 [Nanorana parkeri]|uniref:probable cation-transporting ATPase 13A4 isoform X1 n=1 Tax=Nanorana parkeri TaxID=125878 RepID=UPI000853F5AB|nr:PREDICTED: probable cation-transporting ATPase 13A4 isoform X1 [Nanorana parkeri]